MKPSAVLNKFDKKVQEVYEALDNLKTLETFVTKTPRI